MVVIWVGDNIFAKFCQNAQNSLIKHFKEVLILNKWNSKNLRACKGRAWVLGGPQQAKRGGQARPMPIKTDYRTRIWHHCYIYIYIYIHIYIYIYIYMMFEKNLYARPTY